MSLQPKMYFTPEEYLEMERFAAYKSEYFNGEIFSMAGATREHNLITTNVLACLHQQLRKRPCEVYPSDMRVKVSETGRYTYPDVTVVCGAPQFEDKQFETLLNPSVIIEVLSSSTEEYDRGEKFKRYWTIKSLSDYILIAQNPYHVEHFTRQSDKLWKISTAASLPEKLYIASIDCEIALEEIYEKVDKFTRAVPDNRNTSANS